AGGEQPLVLGLGPGAGLVDDLLTVSASLLADGGGLLAGGRELLLLIALELVDLLLDLLRVAQTALDLLRALVQHGVQPRQHELHEDDREDHQEDQRPDDLRGQRDQEAPARDWLCSFGKNHGGGPQPKSRPVTIASRVRISVKAIPMNMVDWSALRSSG